MLEYLEYLQFSTALPFGYFLFFILCITLVLWSIKNIIFLRHRKDSKLKLTISSFALMFVSIIVYANITFEGKLEVNPLFQEADIIGNWKDGDSTIEFKSDKTVNFNFGKRYASRLTSPLSGQGVWSKHNDFNISITNSPTSIPALRVIIFDNSYRMIVDDFGDFDMWDHHLGFKKQ